MKPGHVENCLFLIEFISIHFGGLNVAWWSYLMSAAFDIMTNALNSMCLVLLVSFFSDVELHSCNGNIHIR